MDDLSKLPNIGKILSDKLHRIGLNNYDDLVAMGSIEAVLRIGQKDKSACYNMLFAIEGAIRGVRWHSMLKEDRAQLKKEFDQAFSL